MPSNSTPPMQDWTIEQLNARYLQISKEMEEVLQERSSPIPTSEELLDPLQRPRVGLYALRLRKIAWEMGRVAEEWRRREDERRE